MIKTLRITSIIVAVLAVASFALPVVFGFRVDKQVEQFLNSAGVIEDFKETKGEKTVDNQRELSPLVKQAEAFALYLNPPPKPTPAAPSVSVVKSEPRPMGPVSAKFRLIGTSRHVMQPELSLALIDEPGKGLSWVRQSSKVGYLIIEQIKDGVIVVRDGQNTFELVAERPAERSLVKAKTAHSGRITGGNSLETIPEVRMSSEEEARLAEQRKKALAELDAMLREEGFIQEDENIEVSETDSGSKAPDIEASTEKSVSDLEAMRISAREARGLGRLGRRLRSVQQEPNRVGSNLK